MTLKSGKVLRAHTLVWGAGLQAHPIAKDLGVPLERGNRIPVGPELSMPDHPEVYAIGDIAWITDAKTSKVLPQLGSVALQAGEQAGENIKRSIEGKQESRSTTTTRGRWPRSDAALPSSRCPVARR